MLITAEASDGRQHGGGFLRLVDRVGIPNFNVEAKGLHFLDQNVERLGDTRLETIIAFNRTELYPPGVAA